MHFSSLSNIKELSISLFIFWYFTQTKRIILMLLSFPYLYTSTVSSNELTHDFSFFPCWCVYHVSLMAPKGIQTLRVVSLDLHASPSPPGALLLVLCLIWAGFSKRLQVRSSRHANSVVEGLEHGHACALFNTYSVLTHKWRNLIALWYQKIRSSFHSNLPLFARLLDFPTNASVWTGTKTLVMS